MAAKRKADAAPLVVEAGKYEIVKGKALDKLVNVTIKTAVEDLKQYIQQACISAAYHVAEHGNCTIINDLCEHVELVTHNNTVRLWFHTYCKFVRWSSKKKAFVVNTDFRRAIIDEKGVARPEQLAEFADKLFAAKMYYEMSKPSEFKPINFLGKIKAMIDKIEELDPEDRNNPKNNFRGLEEIKTVLQRMHAA